MLNINGPEAVILAVLFLILFGPERLPELAVQVGKWVREFRQLTEGATADIARELTAAAGELRDVESEARSIGAATRRALLGDTLIQRGDDPAVPVDSQVIAPASPTAPASDQVETLPGETATGPDQLETPPASPTATASDQVVAPLGQSSTPPDQVDAPIEPTAPVCHATVKLPDPTEDAK